MKKAGAWLLVWVGLFPGGGWGAETLRREIPWRFAPPELVKRIVQPQLSPEGRFVILREKGTVLVIDEPDRVMAAAEAMAGAEIPPPRVQLSLGLETGGRARAPGTGAAGRVTGPTGNEGFVPFPTGYRAPRVASGGARGGVVLPAHPTGFRRRSVGQQMDVTPSVNVDGSLGMEVNAEDVEFAGFVSYGSPIVAAGTAAVFPLASNLSHAEAFRPYLGSEVKLPLLETTRVSSSLLLRPELEGNQLIVHFLPQLRLENGKPGDVAQSEQVTLRTLASQALVPAGKVVRMAGFAEAPPEFNALFFAPAVGGDGLTRLVLKAEVRPAE